MTSSEYIRLKKKLHLASTVLNFLLPLKLPFLSKHRFNKLLEKLSEIRVYIDMTSSMALTSSHISKKPGVLSWWNQPVEDGYTVVIKG